jgi:hypothetical protein
MVLLFSREREREREWEKLSAVAVPPKLADPSKQTGLVSGKVTRLGEIRQLSDCSLWVVFVKITEVAYIHNWAIFPREKLCNNFYNKWIGLHFG